MYIVFRKKNNQKGLFRQKAIVQDVLDLTHKDVCDPLNVRAREDFEYFITFIDDYSRYDYVYLLLHKSEAFEKFKKFGIEAEKPLDKNRKSL